MEALPLLRLPRKATGNRPETPAAGAEVNAKTDKGLTAFIQAVEKGHTETVQALLTAGAEVNAKEKENFALSQAAKYGHTETVHTLPLALKSKLKINMEAQPFIGRPPMDTLKRFKHFAAGTKVNAKDSSGKQPFIGRPDTARLKPSRYPCCWRSG